MNDMPLDWSKVETERLQEEKAEAWRAKVCYSGCTLLLVGIIGATVAGYWQSLPGALFGGFVFLIGLILVVYWNSLAKSASDA